MENIRNGKIWHIFTLQPYIVIFKSMDLKSTPRSTKFEKDSTPGLVIITIDTNREQGVCVCVNLCHKIGASDSARDMRYVYQLKNIDDPKLFSHFWKGHWKFQRPCVVAVIRQKKSLDRTYHQVLRKIPQKCQIWRTSSLTIMLMFGPKCLIWVKMRSKRK